MTTYFTFMEKVLSTMGINFTIEKKYDKFLRAFSMTMVVLATIHSFLYVMSTGVLDMQLANAITMGLFSFQGTLKFSFVLMNLKRIVKIKGKLEKLMKTAKIESSEENVKQLDNFRKVTKLCVMGSLLCIWIFHFKPLIEIITSNLTSVVTVKTLPFAFYFPVQGIEVDYFFPVYLYEVMAGHILTIVPLALDGLIMLMVGQLVILFNNVGEAFKTTIDNHEVVMKSVTKKKLIETIDLHNKVFDLSSELFKIYEIGLLAHILLQTGTICFIAFIISVLYKLFRLEALKKL